MKKIFLALFFAAISVAAFSQDQLPYGTATGTNTYAATIPGAVATLKDGSQVMIKLGNANTNTSTLNLNSLGAKAIKLNGVALVSGDLPANVYMIFTYNASTSSWQVSKPGSGGGSPPAGAWSLTGNVLGADTKWVGSSDNFNVGFKTNNTVRETILKGGQHIWGSGTTLSGSETYSFQGGDIYVDDNFLVNNALTTSTRTLFGTHWVYGANYGAAFTDRSLVDKGYVDSLRAIGITVGTTAITSGTSGAVPFNDGGVYGEDATQFFWDKTNNRLGLGTNSPANTLDVSGSGTYPIRLTSSGTTAGIDFNSSALRMVLGIEPSIPFLVYDYTAAQYLMSFTSAAGSLNMLDGRDVSRFIQITNNGSAGGRVFLGVEKTAGDNYTNSLSYAGILASATNAGATNHALQFGVASQIDMTIDTDHEIGMGINAPTAKLDIVGLTSNSSASGLLVEALDGTDNFTVRNDGAIATTYSVNATAGDAITINKAAGQFVKDQTGTTFTLTNSLITTSSQILFSRNTVGVTTGNDIVVVAGSGSAVFTFQTAGVAGNPSADIAISFFVLNY